MIFPFKPGTAAGTAAALLAIASAPAAAHTSYLLPNLFTANTEGQVTLQSSFSDAFPHAEIPVDSDDWHVPLPEGSKAEYETVATHKQLVLLESPLAEEGTYRFTTGVRHGRKGVVALVDGEWVRVPGDEIPTGATETKSSQTETVADVYVTKKAPTRAAVDRPIGRLVVHPITHPNDVYLGEPFDLEILFDGKPMAGQSVEIERAGSEYDDSRFHGIVETGADGRLSLDLDRPGTYLLMTRHLAAAPAGADTDERSYTTSLTFEVQR